MKGLVCLLVLGPATLVSAQQCRISGQVFFANVIDRTITLKTDSGDLVNFSYDGATDFELTESGSPRVGVTKVTPDELNNGDRLCVRTSEPVIVTVTPRRTIEAGQKQELTRWQSDSLYGVVSGLDRNARRITLWGTSAGQTKSYSVGVSPDAAYWFLPRNAASLGDAVRRSWDSIAPGDTLYLRGAKDGAGQNFVASLLVSGGFRSFASTVETIEPLKEMLRVHLLLSGNARMVHIRPGAFYAIAGAEGKAPGQPRLYAIDAADLKPGDTVLILGIDDGQGSLRACALIAGFSPFGALPPDPNQQMRWIFDNASFQ